MKIWKYIASIVAVFGTTSLLLSALTLFSLAELRSEMEEIIDHDAHLVYMTIEQQSAHTNELHAYSQWYFARRLGDAAIVAELAEQRERHCEQADAALQQSIAFLEDELDESAGRSAYERDEAHEFYGPALSSLHEIASLRALVDEMIVELDAATASGRIQDDREISAAVLQGFAYISEHTDAVLRAADAAMEQTLRETEIVVEQLTTTLLALIFASFFAGSVFAFLVTKRLKGAIGRVAEKASAASDSVAHGEYDFDRFDTRDDGDFAGLLNAFNELLSRVKQSADDLIEARVEAEKANQAKSQFLAHMSHEIRTPLTAIIGFAEEMEQDDTFPDSQVYNLKHITSSGEHLFEMINDVLEMAQVESGAITVKESVCDVPALLRSIHAMFEQKATRNHLASEVRIDASVPPLLMLDEGKLRHILINLLGNAFKWTQQGSVTVTAKMTEDPRPALEIAVADTGCGISSAGLDQIFEPFERGDSHGNHAPGTGLGLAICRKFSGALQGELTAESTPGAGSVFTLKLPAVPVVDSAAADPVGYANPQQPEDSGVESPASGDAGERDGHDPLVLVVDDNETNRELIGKLLAREPYALCFANDGKEAVRQFRERSPALILMDMSMPIMDGYEATRAIRSAPGGDAVAIIAVTGNAFAGDIERMRAAGVDDVVSKPFRRAKMIEHIEKLLYGRRAEQTSA